MEMGKLTAKLRDAVPVCLLVEGKEIKRFRNIEIPDELKKLEYQDFKFDVPLNGAITFKIMFEAGVLPEEFPQTRERRTRKPLAQEAQSQEVAPAANEAAEAESQPQDEQATEALPVSVVEAFAQALENTQAAGESVADIAAAMANGEVIEDEVIGDESKGRLIVITAEPVEAEAMPEPVEATAEPVTQPKDREPAKRLTRKGKGKKDAAPAEDEGK